MSKEIPWGKPPRTIQEIIKDVGPYGIPRCTLPSTPPCEYVTSEDILRDLNKVMHPCAIKPRYAMLGIIPMAKLFEVTEEHIRDKLGDPPYMLDFQTGIIKPCTGMEGYFEDDKRRTFDHEPITNVNIELSIDRDMDSSSDKKGSDND